MPAQTRFPHFEGGPEIGVHFIQRLNLVAAVTVFSCLQVTATGYGQTVTLSVKNTPLEKIFKEVKMQTGFSFVYTRNQLKSSFPVTLNVVKAALNEVLSICFSNQPLSFVIEENYVIVQTKSTVKPALSDSVKDISGIVVNENSEPLQSVTITLLKSGRITLTDIHGQFSLTGVNNNDIILITSVLQK